MAYDQALFDSVENRDSHGEGWGEAFDHLEELLLSAEKPRGDRP